MNIAAGAHSQGSSRAYADLHGDVSGSVAPGHEAAVDPRTTDLLMPHPVYGRLGWVAVVDPAERTGEQVLTLLEAAHAAAWARWQRRHDNAGA